MAFGGLPEQVLNRTVEQDQLAISDYIEAEILRILTGKFARPSLSVRQQLNDLLNEALFVRVTGEIRDVCRDPKDDAILETAWLASADYLVSGDKDLLDLKEFRGTKIITPAAYLGLI